MDRKLAGSKRWTAVTEDGGRVWSCAVAPAVEKRFTSLFWGCAGEVELGRRRERGTRKGSGVGDGGRRGVVVMFGESRYVTTS